MQKETERESEGVADRERESARKGKDSTERRRGRQRDTLTKSWRPWRVQCIGWKSGVKARLQPRQERERMSETVRLVVPAINCRESRQRRTGTGTSSFDISRGNAVSFIFSTVRARKRIDGSGFPLHRKKEKRIEEKGWTVPASLLFLLLLGRTWLHTSKENSLTQINWFPQWLQRVVDNWLSKIKWLFHAVSSLQKTIR